jgi:hypothetical protein
MSTAINSRNSAGAKLAAPRPRPTRVLSMEILQDSPLARFVLASAHPYLRRAFAAK